MPILISIPDNCKVLGDVVTQLVTSVERAQRRADGGRAVNYAHIERELGDRVVGQGATWAYDKVTDLTGYEFAWPFN